MTTPSLNPDIIPAELKERAQWVCWRWTEVIDQKTGEVKWTKPPFQTNGRHASSTRSETWVTFDEALAGVDWSTSWKKALPLSGIGFVVTAADPYVGVDLDHCVDLETGQLEPWAREIIDQLDSYTEISPSNTGVRCFLKGNLPPVGRKRGKFEIYDRGRYLTVTANHLPGTPSTIQYRQAEIDQIHSKIWKDRKREKPPARPAPTEELDDLTIIAKASNAKNSAKFNRLWVGDREGYRSPSEADMALCSILSFWAGGNLVKIDRLFRKSGLMSEKWDRKTGDATYGSLTLSKINDETSYSAPEPSVNGTQNENRNGHIEHTPIPVPDSNSVGPFPLTDLGNAERLVARHGKDLRYCWPGKQWYIWDETRWAPDDTGEIYRRATNTARNIYAEATDVDDSNLREAIADWAKKCESSARIEQMINLAKSQPAIPVKMDEWDRNPWLLNVANGTLELRSGDLLGHRREDLITLISSVTYDSRSQDTKWASFLDKILPDLNLQGFVQRALGYSITGDCREEVLFFPYGPTQTGKSTLLRAVAAALGDYAVTADFGTFLARDKSASGPRNDIAALAGKRLIVSMEVDKDQKLAESVVKQLTGGDVIRARFLFRESFEFTPTFKLWLGANDRPRVRDDDDAIWRRILQIPFEQRISDQERDNSLKDYLSDTERAGPAILAWLVQGCLNWQVIGLAVDDSTKALTSNYRVDMDPIKDFLDDCCLTSPEAQVRNPDLYQAYEDWAKANGVKRPMTQRALSQRLKARGYEQEIGHRARIWYGLGLLAQG